MKAFKSGFGICNIVLSIFSVGVMGLTTVAGLSGCTSVDMNLPEPIVESPEVVGETGRGMIGLGYFNTHTVSAVNNGASRPPVLRAQDEDGSGDLSLDGDIGLFRRFQVGVRLGPITPIGLLEVKYQIWGSPLLGTETSGDTPELESDRILVAVFGRVGQGSRSAHGDQQSTFGPGGFPWSATGQLGVMGAGFSLGYRIHPTFSIFTGGAFDRYHVHASDSQDPSSDGTSQGGQYSQDYDGSASTFAIGFTWGRKYTLTGYGAGTRLAWPNIDNAINFRVGLDARFILF
jgi:hypothetical protein